MVQSDHSSGGGWSLLTSTLSLWHLNRLLKHLSLMLAFSMLKQEITVDVGQRLMEATLSGPVGGVMHI